MEKKAKIQRAETRKDRDVKKKINGREMRKRSQKSDLKNVYFLSIILDT
jgi:hypothetical protein